MYYNRLLEHHRTEEHSIRRMMSMLMRMGIAEFASVGGQDIHRFQWNHSKLPKINR